MMPACKSKPQAIFITVVSASPGFSVPEAAASCFALLLHAVVNTKDTIKTNRNILFLLLIIFFLLTAVTSTNEIEQKCCFNILPYTFNTIEAAKFKQIEFFYALNP
ncbi:hypothetical protein SDC9_158194 [bioreactor metagenome]|uniref:Uncharacterized protein n=1 Tax=bioreactor metagenome TaxID=1076179 RepID=A0A645F9H9_9ZZZZ